MKNVSDWYTARAPQILSVLRIMIALLFMQHGAMKLFGFPAPMGNFPLLSVIGFAGILEVFGGALVLLGLFTRPIAFLLSGEMAVGYFTAHAPHGFWPVLNHGELAVLYCFGFLYLSAAGGGDWSLDRLIRRAAPADES